ncbi:maltooligosyl trehalose hydrolase [Sanguibacter keddieii DSM 10542]|uniref:Malto-oligosyltrehalose trehalohydrolase n=1 Tax=Sanguibacter keddieii (strain ATCC 51767 / DSM 10542 / NCFB 3025 / ST-74) TaxID=446469 RepID=D1BGM2_SANKS|nr:malto-oligosyltrehalose trehalohydrolase [Sanguibacter keddieii]ACZ21599.1 maltooligosyl trehalose hydrolase [Sanguibacter keddieii DSM 10542]
MSTRTTFAVWAPDAERVDLVRVDPARQDFSHVDETVPLVHDPVRGAGWWSSTEGAHDGDLYGFSVDGGPARPDPRSTRQPFGVHGPSQVFDAAAHLWSDGGWQGRAVEGSVVYELHLGTFTPAGTLDAAVERLGHLADLGVDLVELMPVAAFDGDHGWGYDGVHLFAVHEPYGGPAALQRFVDAAHAAGMGVVLDVVYNHLGPSGNYTSTFGPYFTDDHETPWGAGLHLDGEGSHEVRRWVIDNALRWFRDFHVDGLRLDAVHALVDDSERHLLAELADETAALSRALHRPLGLIAESDENDPATVTPTRATGSVDEPGASGEPVEDVRPKGMTAQWADDVHHALHALLTSERHGYYVDFGSPEVLRTTLTEVFLHSGTYSTFRGQTWGHRVPVDVDGHRFVVFSTDHDQVGNRALGDRPGRPARPGEGEVDLDLLAASAAVVLTSAFTPMLFMGEEWGATTPWQFFTDFTDPELGRLVTEGRTKEFSGHDWSSIYGDDVTVPDPQDRATFDGSKVRWEETAAPGHDALLEWHRVLIALRRSEPDLGSGDRSQVEVRWSGTSSEDGTPAVLVLRHGSVVTVVNLSDEVQAETLEESDLGSAGVAPEILATWNEAALTGRELRLSPGAVAVVKA